MKIHWPSIRQRYLQVFAFYGFVSVLCVALWPSTTYLIHGGVLSVGPFARPTTWGEIGVELLNNVILGMFTGAITWSMIEFGRYLIDESHCHVDSVGGHGWPKGWRGLLLVNGSIFCGPLLAAPTFVYFFDGVTLHDITLRDHVIYMVVSIITNAVIIYYICNRIKHQYLANAIATVQRRATEARLMLIATQLEPHMLFNMLANLRALITSDQPRAVAMLDRIESYLRVTLDGSRALAYPLAAEFDRLGDYLALMAVRMGKRLRYTLDLPKELRAVPVPPLLLQPLVENAIKHGLDPRVEGGRVAVSAQREGGLLVLTVRDNGVGFDTSVPLPDGDHFGLPHVLERVASAYGGRGQVDVQSQPGADTVVCIYLPLS